MRLFAVGLALCAFSASAAEPIDADSIATAEKLRDKALAFGTAAATLLESLTPELGPRMAGSPNDARAVAWAQQKFRELRYDKVWTEPVVFPRWVRKRESAEVVAPC